MDELRLDVEEPPTPEHRQLLMDGLLAHRAQDLGDPEFRSVGLFLRDADGEMVAGLAGRMRWGWLFVEMLWVAKHLRGQGHGGRLLEEAEAYARRHGGIALHLDCADDALAFYERHGYEVAATIVGYPARGMHQYFMRKWLTSP